MPRRLRKDAHTTDPPAVRAPRRQATGQRLGDRDPSTGRFLPGNGAAAQTGLRVARTRRNIGAGLDEEVESFLEASITDDGGREAIPTRRLSQHQYRAPNPCHRHSCWPTTAPRSSG